MRIRSNFVACNTAQIERSHCVQHLLQATKLHSVSSPIKDEVIDGCNVEGTGRILHLLLVIAASR